MCPNYGFLTRSPPSLLAGSRGSVRQLSSGTMEGLRLPGFLPATLRFLRVAVTLSSLPGFAPHRAAECPAWPGRCSTGAVHILRYFEKEKPGPPKFPVNPSMPLPCSQTPVGCPRQAFAASPCCPRLSDDEGSNTDHYFEAQSHGFGIRSIRFVPPSLTTTQCSLPAGGQPLPDGIGYPLGSCKMFQSAFSITYSFSLSRFSLARQTS